MSETYSDIITNYDVTWDCMLKHMQISEEETKYLKELGDKNRELMDRWYGVAGDAFQQMASTIEVQMGDTIVFSDNCAIGNQMLITNFTTADESRSEALKVTPISN